MIRPALFLTSVMFAAAFLLAAAGPAAGPSGDAAPPSTVLLKGATVWTMGPEGVLQDADLLIEDGKIAKIGRGISPPAGAEVLDMKGKHVTPGLIDAHSHTAIAGGVNEGSNNVVAEVRIKDVLNPHDVAIYRELAGGLTTANVLHGSADSIGGQTSIIKLRWGEPAASLLFEKAPPGIKFALGENPKRSNFRRPGMEQRYPATRMGVAASIRKALLAARDYAREWKDYDALSPRERAHRAPPRKDYQMEALVEVLEGKRQVHAHCYRQDEILMLLRIADEFGFKIGTLQHVLEGYKVADEIAAHGAGASTFSDWWAYKAEAYDAIPYNAALMTRRGVLVSVNSDSDELARRLNLEAAKAIKYGGLSDVQALALVTINPAKQLHIDRWVGSLEKGKDADVAVWSGNPLSVYSNCEKTFVDGVERFDRGEDLAGREKAEAERASLIRQVQEIDKPRVGKQGKAGEGAEAPKAAGSAKETPPAAEAGPVPLDYHVPPGWAEGVVALVGGTVHTVSGPDIPHGTIVIRDGKIAAVGADLKAPAGAEIVDVRGLQVYPGMIDADTVMGLTEISSVPGMEDVEETGKINPDARVELAINPDSTLIPVTRANGITHVLTEPGGGLVSGTSALIRLDGWTWEDLTASAPVALHVNYPAWRAGFSFETFSRKSEEDVKKEREEAFKALDKLFTDARAYKQARDAEGKGGVRPERVPSLEAMLPVLDGKIPVIVQAAEIRQIKSALDWAAKEKVRIIISGGADAWRVADLLKARNVPVILGPILDLPDRRDEPYDTRFTAAKRLHDAGVTFCISGGGGVFNAPDTRNLPYHAAMAAAFGLDKAEAVRAVTLYPARILGVESRLGSIDVGKSASIVVTDGDLLEIRTQVLKVFIDGRPADLMNKHKRLYERYKSRPLPAAAR